MWRKNVKILLIDDDPADRDLLTRRLRRAFEPLTCVEVSRRQDFEAAMAEGGFDVMITDYQLKWSDGLWVLRRCRESYPDLPVIMYTDTGNEEIAVEGMKAGLNDYVLKSHPTRLPIAVQESLEKARLRRAQVEAEAALKQAKDTLERTVDERTAELKALNTQLHEDIAQRQHVEQALRESQASLQALLDHTTAIIYLIDPKGRFLLINRQFEQLFHATKAQVVGQPLEAVFSEDIAAAFRANNLQVFAAGTAQQFEELAPHDDGLHTYISIKVPLHDATGSAYALCGISTDITERKRVEEDLKTALAEKEVLLKEVYHRIKNNLQIISSLLDLQAETVPDPQVRALFADSQQRIQAVALIHESLHQAGNVRRIPAAEYINRLSTQVFQAYTSPSDRITLSVQADPLWIEAQQAIPCGLIINELLSNSLKYAFPSDQSGEITIGLRADAAGQVVLTVGDTGVGFPAHVDFRHTESLGMQLVCLLTEQLGGSIELDCATGTRWTLRCPLASS
jgi:PAS domain S-box-containing protein